MVAYVDMKIENFGGTKKIYTCVSALTASVALLLPGLAYAGRPWQDAKN